MGVEVERTSVASIIAAARSNLKRDGKRDVRDTSEDDDASEEEEGQASNDESGSESGESDSDDGESSDDEVDDAQHATSMESDVLKVRDGPKGKKKKAAPDEEQNEESSDESNSEEESDQEPDSDEEDLAEKAKAAAFFDSSHTTDQNDTIDTFTQLGLSRPLLRGVASMGFVTPTPIQASVLPVAMAGRDVCASAVTGSGGQC